MRTRAIGFLSALLSLAAGAPPHRGREATSRAEWWTNGESRLRRTVNRRFTFAEYHPGETGKARQILLAETFDRLLDSQREGERSSVSVEAFALSGESRKPLWKLHAEGSSGGPDGELYRVRRPGCCGARDLDVYYSLAEGRELFASDGPILRLEVPNSPLRRYAAYHSLVAASPIPEASRTKDVIGVLEWGGDRAPAARVLVTAPPSPSEDDYARQTLAFLQSGKPVADTTFDLWSADKSADPSRISGFSIRVECYASPGFLFEIPVVADRLDLAHARTAPGVRLQAVSGR